MKYQIKLILFTSCSTNSHRRIELRILQMATLGSCSICFTDDITLCKTQCNHEFCLNCLTTIGLTSTCNENDLKCPMCRAVIYKCDMLMCNAIAGTVVNNPPECVTKRSICEALYKRYINRVSLKDIADMPGLQLKHRLQLIHLWVDIKNSLSLAVDALWCPEDYDVVVNTLNMVHWYSNIILNDKIIVLKRDNVDEEIIAKLRDYQLLTTASVTFFRYYLSGITFYDEGYESDSDDEDIGFQCDLSSEIASVLFPTIKYERCECQCQCQSTSHDAE